MSEEPPLAANASGSGGTRGGEPSSIADPARATPQGASGPGETHSWTRSHLPACTILLLALALRLYRLPVQSMWWDEGHSLFVAGHDLGAIPTVPAMDVHPPLYFWLLHLWMGPAGTSEFALRFLSLLFSVLTVALCYRAGRDLLGPAGGWAAALLAAASPLYLAYAQEVRMYALVSAFSLLSVYFFYRYCYRDTALKSAGLYALATAAGLYTHYFVGFLLIAENLYWLGWLIASGRWRRPREWLVWAGGQALILALLAPQIITAARQVTSYKNVNLVPPAAADFLVECWRAFVLGLSGTGSQAGLWMAGVAGVLAVGLLARYLPRPDSKVPSGALALWLFCFAAPLGIYYLVLLDRASFSPRYMIVVTPALYILLAYAAWQLGRRWLPLGIAALALLLAIFGLAGYEYFANPAQAKDDTRGLARFLEREAAPNDAIFVDVPHPLDYYYRGAAPQRYLFVDAHTIADVLTEAASGRDRLFFARWRQSDTDPRGAVLFLLDKYGRRQGEKQFRGYDVVWYDLPRPAQFSLPTALEPASANFGGQVALVGQAFGGRGQGPTSSDDEARRREVPAGKSAWATLGWSLPPGPLPADRRDYKVGLYLRDGRGHRVAQADRDLLNDRHLHTSAWQPGETALNVYTLPVAPGAPPGEYTLEAAVYPTSDVSPLPVLDGAGAPRGTLAELGKLRVVRPDEAPDVEALGIGRRLDQPLGDDLRLLGYDLPSASAQAGGSLPLTLFWQARRDVGQDYLIRTALFDAGGAARAENTDRPAGGTYTTTQWVKGEVLRDTIDLGVPAQIAPGTYDLRVAALPVGASAVLTPSEVSLGPVEVQGRSHSFSAPPIGNPLKVNFDNQIELLGYDLDAGAVGGQGPLRATLYWKALDQARASYKVFTHLLDADGRMWGQKDDYPGAGTLPTTGWVKGEVITDTYDIPVDPKAPPGSYQLEVGLYEPQSGGRLPIVGADGGAAGDHALIPVTLGGGQ